MQAPARRTRHPGSILHAPAGMCARPPRAKSKSTDESDGTRLFTRGFAQLEREETKRLRPQTRQITETAPPPRRRNNHKHSRNRNSNSRLCPPYPSHCDCHARHSCEWRILDTEYLCVWVIWKGKVYACAKALAAAGSRTMVMGVHCPCANGYKWRQENAPQS